MKQELPSPAVGFHASHRTSSVRSRVAPLLLPAAVLGPWVLLAVWVVPQVLLLLLNLQAWELASGEVSPSQRTLAATILVAELVSLVGGIVTVGALWLRGLVFNRWLGAVPLGLGVVFMAVVFNLVDRLIPNTLADWMLPRDQWVLKQFALVMPAALFGALRLLCPERESAEDRAGSLGSAIAVTIALFVACLAVPFVSSPLWALIRELSADFQPFGAAVLTGIYLSLALLAAGSLLRVCISFYLAARASSPAALGVFAVLVAIVGPLGGLWLNAGIPFPADFQTPAIYLLALLNGVVLMLPNFSYPLAHRLVWLAQCAMFPFTLYFFAVFLPFLPLGPLSMLLAGLGVLIYVPSLLFLFHGYRLLDGFRAEIRDGSRWFPALLGIGAILIWPVAYTVQASRDKAALHGALDYLQYPDYAANAKFGGSISALRSSLVHLDEFKRGNYLPYLSEYYNWLAFDNLVLPQPKLDGLAQAFLGEALPKPSGENMRLDMFGWGRNRARNVTEVLAGASGERPRADARLEQLRSSAKTEDGTVRAIAALTIGNPTANPTEFSTTIQVPSGVMVSGLWLTIGTERVPGRLFEKRSALWVYQKITEVRPVPRDPAILRYIGPNLVELRVFPVEPASPRHVEVEFLYPEGLNPKIIVGADGVVETPHAAHEAISVARTDSGNFGVVLPRELGLPVVTRQPYIHFLVDVSKDSRFSAGIVLQRELQRVSRQFSHVREARLTFVNFETADFHRGEMISIEELLRLPELQPPSFKGGFVPDRAIKEVVWRQHLALSQPYSSAFTHYPQIVVLAGSDHPRPAVDTGNLAEFSRWAPDMPGYWEVSAEGAPPRFIPLSPGREPSAAVHICQIGGERFAAAAGEPASFISLNPAKGTLDKIEAYDPAAGKFVPVAAGLENPPDYAGAVVPWSLELRRIFEPFRSRSGDLAELLKLCRDTGILVPSVAYMVVENTAQWKMLERTEKKTLKGHEALELSESTVPEPGTLALVVFAVLVLLVLARRRRPAV